MVFIAEIGFAVAFGVLMDTIVVRSVLVTALTLDVGQWMWWPSKLSAKRDEAPVEPPRPEPAEVGSALSAAPGRAPLGDIFGVRALKMSRSPRTGGVRGR